MTLTESLDMHPGPPSEWVMVRYYGGPRDGESLESTVMSSDLKGTIRLSGGQYSLQGFRSSCSIGALKQFAIDYAIYEWEQL